jgi:hypothetical protein
LSCFERAFASFNSALASTARDQAPLDWAAINNNLGRAFMTLESLERGRKRRIELLTQAIAAYTKAVDATPRGIAMILQNTAALLCLAAAPRAGDALAPQRLSFKVESANAS